MQADLVLAKYTCIALNRVSGTVKKVKGLFPLLSWRVMTRSDSQITPLRPGSLDDISVRFAMDSPVFTRLQETILHPSVRKEWFVRPLWSGVAFFQLLTLDFFTGTSLRFSTAEQAINTIYGLGDQPDALCSVILQEMTKRVFGGSPAPPPPSDEETPPVVEAEDASQEVGAETPASRDPSAAPTQQRSVSAAASVTQDPTFGNAFELSQLLFVAGHCAIKQLVHLELVERDTKRRKAAEDKKVGAKASGQDELDQVAGSVEDEIGDIIAAAREHELLYGEKSLLTVFGPMAATIVSQPKVYKVRKLGLVHLHPLG